MLTVTTHDGLTFTGTAQEIVRAMRNMQWNAPVLKRDWMVEAADRAAQQTGKRIVANRGARPFLKSLADADVIAIRDSTKPH